MITKPPCHVFTATSANTHGLRAHDIHWSTHVFTVLMKHTKSLTLRIQTHGLVCKTDVDCLPPLLETSPSLANISITHSASQKPSCTLQKELSSSRLHQIPSWWRKRAEVLKVSRRSDHLYESCAVKHQSP